MHIDQILVTRIQAPLTTLTVRPSKDNGMRESTPTTNYGSRTYGNGSDLINDTGRTIFSFDISALPSGLNLISAILDLTPFTTGTPLAGKIVQFCKLTQPDWVETEATWNIYSTGNNWTSLGGDFVTTNPTAAEFTFATPIPDFIRNVDLIDLVQDAIDNSIDLHVLMKFKTEGLAAGQRGVWLPWCREATPNSRDPVLAINYYI